MIGMSTDYEAFKMNILDTLAMTLVHNTKTVQQASKTLYSLRDIQGYCSTLMEIIDSVCIKIEIRQAALVQLKNSIRAKWKQMSSNTNTRNTAISSKEKEFIRVNIIQSVLRIANNYPLLKQYKEILTILVGYDFKQWDIVSQTKKLLQTSDENICNTIQVLMAIIVAFQFSITEQEKQYLFQLILITLPVLAEKYSRVQSAQLTYLLVKYLWRCIHFEINQQVKILVLKWMPLLKMILMAENQAYKNLQPQDLEQQARNSNQFYYFHAKKWTLKLIYQFYYKHAKLQDYKVQSKSYQYSNLWYQQYGDEFIHVIFAQLSQPASIKIRYYQLKSILIVSQEKPNLVLKFYKPLLFQILVPYMLLQKQDFQLAHQDPIQLLSRQEYVYQNFKNLKRLASQLWINIAGIGFTSAEKKRAYTHNPGQPFYSCVAQMKQYLNSSNTRYKELGLYIFCRMRSLIVKTVVKQLVPQLIDKYVLNELNCSEKMLRARALQVLHQYIARVKFELITLQKILSHVYVCFSADPQPLVNIRAALTIPVFFKIPEMVDILKIKISQMLQLYLRIIDKYDIEPLVNALQFVVQKFPQEVVPHAKNLVQALTHQFMRLYTKDILQSNKQNYKGEIQLAAEGCLRVLVFLLDNPYSKKFIDQIHSDLIKFIKTMLQVTGTQYMQNIFSILSTLAFHSKTLTKELWFFYQVAIYSVMGVSEPALISNLSCGETEKYILQSIRDGNGVETFQQIVIYIRWFILKGGQTLMKGKTLFNSTYFQLFCSLIVDIYSRGSTQYSIDIQLKYCIMLMMYFLQTYQTLPDEVLKHFWPIVKHNIQNQKGSKQIKCYNLQLISLMIWTGQARMVNLLQKNNLMETVIKQFLRSSKKLQNQFERQRLILGFSLLISLMNRSRILSNNLPAIYKCLLMLVRQNIQGRIASLSQDEELYENFSEEGEDDNEQKKIINKLAGYIDNNFQKKPLIPFGQEKTSDQELQQLVKQVAEDQDYYYLPIESDSDLYWSDLLDDMVQTKLSKIDEIKYFKQKRNRIKKNEKDLYCSLIKGTTSEQIKYFDIRMQQAIKCFERI